MQRSSFLLASLLLLAACRKDKDTDTAPANGTPSAPTLHPHLHLAVDSACIVTGNVVTPNADGINDVIALVAINAVDVSVELRDASGAVLYSGTHEGLWDLALPAPTSDQAPIPLTLSVEGTSTSGLPLSGSAVIYSVTDLDTHCFSSAVAPITGDQFVSYIPFPRMICDPESPSNDVFCTE